MNTPLRIFFLIIILSAAAILSCSSSIASVTATDRYVDLSGVKGNDILDGLTNDCSNLDHPCRTMSHALQQVSASDTIVIGCYASPGTDTVETDSFECPWDCSSDMELLVKVAHVTFRAANSSEPSLLPISLSSFNPDTPLSLVPPNGLLCHDTVFINMATSHSTLHMQRLRFSKLSEHGISYPIISAFGLDGNNVELDRVYIEDSDSEFGAITFLETGLFSITIKNSYFFNISSEFAAVYAWSYAFIEGRSDITIQNSIFERCSRALKIFAEINAKLSSLEISNSTFNNNRAKSDGAAVNVQSISLLSISNCNFTGNHADDKGGAIYTKDVLDLSVTNSAFIGNSAGADGGAINCEKGKSVLVQSSTFEENTAGSFGGSVTILSSSNAIMMDSRFIGNNAGISSGAIFTERITSVTVERCLFELNTAETDSGALRVDRSSRINIRTSTFNDNVVALFAGAILFQDHSSSVENRIDIEQCTFARNKATNDRSSAGAVAIMDTNRNSLHVNVIDCNFVNCTAAVGGAFQAYGLGGILIFENTEFLSNKALREGGALKLHHLSSEVQINNCSFIKNEVDLISEQGGAVYISNVVLPADHKRYCLTANNTLFESNSARYGGAIFTAEHFTAQFVSCIFKNNYASKSGGAILLRGVSVSSVLIEDEARQYMYVSVKPVFFLDHF